MVWTGPVDLDPDPRISTRRPPWLSACSDWSDALACMSREDVRWLDKQWRMATEANRGEPDIWMTTEAIR